MKLFGMLKKSLGLMGLLAAGALIGNVAAYPALGIAQSPSPIVPEEQGIKSVNVDTFACTPIDGGTDDVSVWVYCKESTSVNTRSFAAPISDSKRAARMLSVILTAIASKQQLNIGFDPSDSSHGNYCAPAICRPINWITARSGL